LGPGAGIGRSGEQARDRQQHACRDNQADQPDLPLRKVEHQSLAADVFGVSTWLIVDLTTRIFTPWAISTSASSSLTLVTRPRMPPPVTTSSPFFTAAIDAWCCFTRCCWGRMTRNQKITKISSKGANWISAAVVPLACPAGAACININIGSWDIRADDFPCGALDHWSGRLDSNQRPPHP